MAQLPTLTDTRVPTRAVTKQPMPPDTATDVPAHPVERPSVFVNMSFLTWPGGSR